MQIQNQFFENQDQLEFGARPWNHEQQPGQFEHRPKPPTDKSKKKITFKEAQKITREKEIQKIQNPRPTSAQLTPKKPEWDERVTKGNGVFDQKLSKNEIFRIESKLKREKEEKMQEMKRQQLENPPKSAVKSYQNIKEIEAAIDKQKQKVQQGQYKKQQRELSQLQWMIEQEQKLKKEQEKQFQEKLKQLKTQEHPDLAKDIAKIKKKEYAAPSPYAQNNQRLSDPQKPKYIGEDEIIIPQARSEVWKDALDVIHHEANRQPLLPGQYDELDLIPEKDVSGKKRRNQGEAVYREAPITASDQKLKEELIEIQKRELKRQHELDALIDKHQKLLKQESQNPNKYYKEINAKLDKLKNKMEPVLKQIEGSSTQSQYPFTGHLLARSVSKLVQLHSESLTEMLLDDILSEMVDILNEIEETQRGRSAEIEQQMAIADYINAIEDLALDQEKVELNFKQSKKEFTKRDRIHSSLQQLDQIRQDQQFFINPYDRLRSIEVSSGFVMKTIEERNKRIGFIRTQAIYTPKQLEQNCIISDELLESLIEDSANNLFLGADDLAEKIFLNEFK